MDSKSPPDHPDMAAVVVAAPAQSPGITKRYRPTPAKTFQCRGFGDCRMVFSRSEHLARHIRKHTGERPFGCHCGKQFSRLDNLRQHAQTVHADKQEQNEAMMRHLTSLHASMAAANKVGQSRGGRRANPPLVDPPSISNGSSAGPAMNLVKQEDFTIKIHPRPGTSTGYEGDHNGLLYHQGATWHLQQTDMDRPDSRPGNNHSFRDPGQSFLAPSTAAAAAPSQSFLPFAPTFSFGLPDPTRGDIRSGSGTSRPPTAGNLTDPSSRTLPPLSAVVSASLSSSSQQQSLFSSPSSQHQQQPTQHILPLPTSYAVRRPFTATRPGTAPASASFFSSKSSSYGGPGMVARPELQLPHGRSNGGIGTELGSAFGVSNYDAEPASPVAGHDSPFFFQPASLLDSQQSTTFASNTAGTSSPHAFNPRKRAFGGPDGPYDDASGYNYGSESRPQSRRLSVLELCNDDGRPDTATTFLLSHSCPPASAGIRTGSARPDTSSSALVTSASALAIVDPVSPNSACGGDSPLLAGTTTPSRGAAASSGGSGVTFAGRGGSPSPKELERSQFSPPPSATSVRFDIPVSTPILHPRSGTGGTAFARASALSSTPSSSPYIGSRSPDGSAPSPGFTTRNAIPSSTDATTASLSRRNHGTGDGKHDQVRIAVSSHASTAVGMRV